MDDYELAKHIHMDMSSNPKLSKREIVLKYKTSHERLTRMESEGLIPYFYKMSSTEAGRKGKNRSPWSKVAACS